MKISKKILSIVLAALMAVSMMPFTAFAAAYSLSDAKSALNNFSYTANFDGQVGTLSGSKESEMVSGENNLTYIRNGLYGEQNAGKSSNDASSDHNTVAIYYPSMTFLYDGTTTLRTPVVVSVYRNNSNVNFWNAKDRYVLGTINNVSGVKLENDVWYGADGSTNWCWLYSNKKKNDIGQISGVYGSTSYRTNKTASTKTAYWANMITFDGTFAAGEYMKEVTPNFTTYITGETNYNYNDIKLTNTGTKTIRYINYKAILDRVDAAKSVVTDANAAKYTEDSMQAVYNAVVAMTAFDYTTYSYDTTANCQTAANAIKSACENYDTAVAGLKIKSCTTHTWVDGTVITAATCTEDGLKNVKCSVCGEESTAPIAKTGHSTSMNSTVKIPATCMTQGTTTYSCKNAGCDYSFDVQDIAVDPNAHSFTNYVSNGNATCTEDGTKTATCDNGCGETNTIDDTDSKTGHSYTTVVTAPTCTEQGYTTHTCTTCNDQYKSDYKEPINHNYGDWTSVDADNHQKVCANDPTHIVTEAHKPVSANNGYAAQVGVAGKEDDTICSECGELLEVGAEIPALEGPQDTANLTLNDTVNANVQLDTDYYVEKAIADGTIDASVTELTVDLTYDTSISSQETTVETVTNYVTTTIGNDVVVTVESAPAKLSQDITISMKADGTEIMTKTYSMEDVCEATIAAYDASTDPVEKASAEVAKTLINYANAAQTYFGYNTTNMAGTKVVEDTDVNTVNAGVTQTGDLNVAANGITFVALANSESRIYLDKSESEFWEANHCMYGDLELTVTGAEGVSAYLGKTAQGRVFIGVTGIKAAYLDDQLTITLASESATKTIEFTAVTYCVNALKGGTTKTSLKALSQAIINYNAKANDLVAANA